MRKILLTVLTLLAVLALILGTTTTAQAAADITRPGSCSVSANWSIATSVNFNNTSGSPSVGTADYAVINSPGPININQSASPVRAYNTQGGELSLAWTYWVRDYDKPGYVYRSDAQNANVNVRRVTINPQSNTGVNCSEYSSRSTIYSAN